MTKTIYEKLQKYNKTKESKKIRLCNSKEVFNYIKSEFKGLNKEIVFFIGVDSKNQVKYKKLMFTGSLNYSIIEIRDLIKECLLNDLSGFFLSHNHPSGDLQSSEKDLNITTQIKKACDIMKIKFLDHLIINYEEDDFYSLFDNDKL
ncbi:hypothetical protein EOM09_08035 [bacterium]|nr:hypothetical protein [bacterium]